MPQAIMHIHKYRHRFSFAIPKPCLKIKANSTRKSGMIRDCAVVANQAKARRKI